MSTLPPRKRAAGERVTSRRAVRARPASAAASAGYSGTPLPNKLGIREGARVVLLGAPAGFERTLGALLEGARLSRRASKAAELVLFFPRDARELATRLPALVDGFTGGLWIARAKRASGVSTDVTEALVRASGLAQGWVDVKVAALDATWSGLRFARRRVGASPPGPGPGGPRPGGAPS